MRERERMSARHEFINKFPRELAEISSGSLPFLLPVNDCELSSTNLWMMYKYIANTRTPPSLSFPLCIACSRVDVVVVGATQLAITVAN